MSPTLRVGVVGLGRMGSGMALNIAKAGFPLSVFDAEEGRTQELRESWVKDKHLPTGVTRCIVSYDATGRFPCFSMAFLCTSTDEKKKSQEHASNKK